MRYWTLQEIEDKIRDEADLLEETFVSDREMIGYINEAIDVAEANIITLYEDYLITETGFVTLTADMSLPADIFANKIRKVEVKEGSRTLQVNKDVHLNQRDYDYNYDYLRYRITNKTGEKPKLNILGSSIPDQINIYYIRNANRLVVPTDECDIPEFASYVIAHVKMRVAEKEIHPLVQKYSADVENYRKLMVETLSNMVDDGTDFLQPEVSFYSDFDSDYLE